MKLSKIFVPPIKCQGIKTKLVSLIRQHVAWQNQGVWIEPFLGSGVVGFNIRPQRAVFADSNPHIINFYNAINQATITPVVVKAFLQKEGSCLSERGKAYYYEVRERFNEQHEPLDFLFLSRAGFNGMIRFNQKGGFNVPFNHKPDRFSQAYITKVVNQTQYIYDLCRTSDYKFVCRDFRKTIADAKPQDFIYCDPPYAGRHVDYYNGWSESDEADLLHLLAKCDCKFILSTWHSNKYRKNPLIAKIQDQYHIITREHYYHVGASEANRNAMLEALILNFKPKTNGAVSFASYQQAQLLEDKPNYNTNDHQEKK